MILSNRNFSAPDNPVGLFVTSPLQIEDRGFLPKYDLNEKRSEQVLQEEVSHDETVPETDGLNQKIAEAYAQGYLKGQQAAVVQDDQIQKDKDVLAAALVRLKIVDETQLVAQLWEAVLTLFQEALGDAKIDKELLRQRCDSAIEMIDTNRGEAFLHVASGDAKILQNYECTIPIVATPELPTGSVHLLYASGEITAGSIAITQEIESRIKRAGGDSC